MEKEKKYWETVKVKDGAFAGIHKMWPLEVISERVFKELNIEVEPQAFAKIPLTETRFGDEKFKPKSQAYVARSFDCLIVVIADDDGNTDIKLFEL